MLHKWLESFSVCVNIAVLICFFVWVSSSVNKDNQENESPNQASPAPTDELSEALNTLESESSKENHTSDSDSDGPILYTDDEDEDDTSSESKMVK